MLSSKANEEIKLKRTKERLEKQKIDQYKRESKNVFHFFTPKNSFLNIEPRKRKKKEEDEVDMFGEGGGFFCDSHAAIEEVKTRKNSVQIPTTTPKKKRKGKSSPSSQLKSSDTFSKRSLKLKEIQEFGNFRVEEIIRYLGNQDFFKATKELDIFLEHIKKV